MSLNRNINRLWIASSKNKGKNGVEKESVILWKTMIHNVENEMIETAFRKMLPAHVFLFRINKFNIEYAECC